MYGEIPTGTVVINVNGRWVEARLGGGISRLDFARNITDTAFVRASNFP
jgi:hypothetical protein